MRKRSALPLISPGTGNLCRRSNRSYLSSFLSKLTATPAPHKNAYTPSFLYKDELNCHQISRSMGTELRAACLWGGEGCRSLSDQHVQVTQGFQYPVNLLIMKSFNNCHSKEDLRNSALNIFQKVSLSPDSSPVHIMQIILLSIYRNGWFWTQANYVPSSSFGIYPLFPKL